jgi:hypothetical protein
MKAVGVMPRANEHWTALAEAAALALHDDLAALVEFATVDREVLLDAFTRVQPSPKAFALRPDLPLDPPTRQRLLTAFIAWGLWTAIDASGTRPPLGELRHDLDRGSGVAALRDLVRNHFGARACAIRVKSALQQVTSTSLRLQLPSGTPDLTITEQIGRELETLALQHATCSTRSTSSASSTRGRSRSPPDSERTCSSSPASVASPCTTGSACPPKPTRRRCAKRAWLPLPAGPAIPSPEPPASRRPPFTAVSTLCSPTHGSRGGPHERPRPDDKAFIRAALTGSVPPLPDYGFGTPETAA